MIVCDDIAMKMWTTVVRMHMHVMIDEQTVTGEHCVHVQHVHTEFADTYVRCAMRVRYILACC